MTRFAIAALLVAAVCACGPSPRVGAAPTPGRPESTASGPGATAHGLTFPTRVLRYALTETNAVEGHPQDKAFRYSDGSRTRVSVFFYPTDSAGAVRDPRQAVANEGQLFEQSLPIGVQRGWYDSYRTAFSDPDSLTVDGRLVLGHTTGAATKRGAQVSVELQYLYLLGTRFLKVRASVPAQGWQNTDVPTFARELATVLARQVHASKQGQ